MVLTRWRNGVERLIKRWSRYLLRVAREWVTTIGILTAPLPFGVFFKPFFLSFFLFFIKKGEETEEKERRQ